MALFKCKMCGGNLEIAEGATIAECEYCGTTQTVPKAIDENLQSLFNRANGLRMKGEFDKAEQLYEKIIQADSTQSEAFWGLILCKYGIEYVDDPKTYKKIPTCHRASYDSIIADDDYKSAIENADMSQRILYEEQAKEIDRIQKDILALAQKEESYDVFICYKETDFNGKRTQDSVIANDIYHQLTQEGFKVFYAAITLEDKLGSDYEPIIFAALNSAKVMLVIGTNPEYFNAVWVKNEWSRYLKIIKSDRSKLLIPCYRDMDAYELPEEFAHLQAQDMGKIGFINDIVRGIKKVIKKDESKNTIVKENSATSASANATPLLERAFIFLEDSQWQQAKEYCNKVLDMEPKNALAYLGIFMASCQIKTRPAIPTAFVSTAPLNNNANFQKALRFADTTLRNELNGYIQAIDSKQKAGHIVSSKREIRKGMTHIALTQDVEDEAFDGCEQINQVTILDGVQNIGEEAFCHCTNLTSITIPDSVTSIEKYAFECCSSLTNINIPDSVTYIGEGAFMGCTSLTSITIPSSITNIGYNMFSDCTGLKNITIPNSVTRINPGAFSDCIGLTNITIPDSITKIGDKAFERCTNLTSITIPGSVTSIGNNAFEDCMGLKSITIPDSVKSIGEGAFKGCTGLNSITVPHSVTSVDKYAFNQCTSLTSINIPDSITYIGEGAFMGCTGLTSITIPDSVTSIGGYAFYGCTGLTSITIPNGVTSIGYYAFEGCSSLTSINIPGGVTSIGSGTFQGCTGLTSIAIPGSVTSIGQMAFNGCTNLTSISIALENTSFSFRFILNDSIETLIITGGSEIPEKAFYRCEYLKSITIPNSVTSIGPSAFEGCARLGSITIPDSVTSIGEYAFSGCISLTNATIPAHFKGKRSHIGFTDQPEITYSGQAPRKGGCYVATCVYGSYDCPQVWTLRRFRDDTLGATWYGRAFIRTYYAISPTLVKWFGETSWFKRMWQGTLDKMVAKLNSDGVADTPYQDKDWR